MTITVDRSKVKEAQKVTGAPTTSAAIDLALTELLRADRLRRDVAAYDASPPTDDEIALAGATVRWADLADDTDWVAAYKEGP